MIPSRELAQLASRLSVTFNPYLRKKPFSQAIAKGAQSLTGTKPTVKFGFSKLAGLITGSTAKAVSDSPVGFRPCSWEHAEKAIAEAVAVIP
jgi:hypothetical protein